MTLRERLNQARRDVLAMPEPKRSRAMLWGAAVMDNHTIDLPIGMALPRWRADELRARIRQQCDEHDRTNEEPPR